MAQTKKESNTKANLRNTLVKSGVVIASTDAPTGLHGRSLSKEESKNLAIEARKHELKQTANHKQQRQQAARLLMSSPSATRSPSSSIKAS